MSALYGQENATVTTENYPSYYYVEVESEDSSAYEMKFGIFQRDDENIINKQDPLAMDMNGFMQQLELQLSKLPNDKKDILVYIHGMWGHRTFFHHQVLNSYQKDVLSDEDSSVGIVVSIIWHSGMNYWTNKDHAYRVGKYFKPVVENLLALPFEEKNFLCHSMGNRVFQGIYSEFENSGNNHMAIDKLILVAADLEENIFDEGQPLESIGDYCSLPVVYVHNNDRSLGMSKALNENERLGLNANEGTCSGNESITIIDVSLVKDNEGFAPSMSNHRYFYTSPAVRNDIKMLLEDNNNPNRSLIGERRWKLTHPEVTKNLSENK